MSPGQYEVQQQRQEGVRLLSGHRAQLGETHTHTHTHTTRPTVSWEPSVLATVCSVSVRWDGLGLEFLTAEVKLNWALLTGGDLWTGRAADVSCDDVSGHPHFFLLSPSANTPFSRSARGRSTSVIDCAHFLHFKRLLGRCLKLMSMPICLVF